MTLGPDVKTDQGPPLIPNSVLVYKGTKLISKDLNDIFFQSLFILSALIILSLGQKIITL